MNALSKYEKDYSNLPFEDILRKYRIKKLIEVLNVAPHQNILDIGCGNEPIYSYYNDINKVTVVEPGEKFYKNAVKLSLGNSKIVVINDFIENIIERLKIEKYDFIIVGGFLHEIPNPNEVLETLKKVSSSDTLVYTYVPNARSFHRLLAYEMGIIKSIYQKSEHDKLFNRQNNFDIQSFNEILVKGGFKIIDKGSYFIKPFTNSQMAKLIEKKLFDNSIYDGLDEMIKYLPELGSELFSLFQVNEQ
jgi:SAM-dependent methyltransferase